MLQIVQIDFGMKSSLKTVESGKAQREKELSMLLKELKSQIDSGMLALE
jgi:hypothetical protein